MTCPKNQISSPYFKIVKERDLCLAHCKESGGKCPVQFLKWTKKWSMYFLKYHLAKITNHDVKYLPKCIDDCKYQFYFDIDAITFFWVGKWPFVNKVGSFFHLDVITEGYL